MPVRTPPLRHPRLLLTLLGLAAISGLLRSWGEAAEFVVKELPGLEWPLPKEGEASFQIVGDMTVHGFSRPITWEATAQFSEDSFSGVAKTSFTFDEADIDVPKVRIVLSVEETMRFELDFLASITSE